MGAGVLGAIASALAHEAGAYQILVVDPNPECRRRATEFGATAAFETGERTARDVLDATDGLGADVVLELAGSTASVEAGIALTRVGGTMVLAGAVAKCASVSLDPEAIVRRMITLRGVHNYHPHDLRTAVDFVARTDSLYPFASLVAEQFPLERATDAFRRAHDAHGVRVAVVA